MLDGGMKRNRHERRCIGERVCDCGISLEDRIPYGSSIARIPDFQRRETHWRKQKTSAGHTIVEPQGVHPSLIHHMMYRGPIIGVWTFGHPGQQLVHQPNAIEMTEDKC